MGITLKRRLTRNSSAGNREPFRFSYGAYRILLLILFIGLPIVAVYGHGAWLNKPQILFTPATDAQINANIAAGNPAIMPNDIVEVIAEFPSITVGTLSGPNGYFTFYVPPGTEVVGASIVDAALSDIPARPARSPVTNEGISRGWGPRGANTFDVTANGWAPTVLPSQCATNTRTAANCNSGLAHVYGDTGIFYSTRADTAFYTGDGSDIASTTNGYLVNPSSTDPWNTITGSTTGARVHNKWDAVQSNAFGSAGVAVNPGFSTQENTRIISTGRGSTPYKAGSPVAGLQSGNTLDRYGTTGPWQRISYPGSCYAQDGFDNPANSIGAVYGQTATATPTSVAICGAASGIALSPAAPLPPATKAVRYAIGGIHTGQTYRIKIRLRAVDPSLIRGFNAEAAGGDSTQGAANGNDNPWRYFVGGPGVAAPAYNGRLGISKSIVAVNGTAYVAGSQIPPNATVRYRISYANTGLNAHTNVQLTDILPLQATGTSNFAVISGANIIPASPPVSGTITFTPIPTFAVSASGSIEFDVALTAATGATVTNEARITSTQRPTAVTSSVSATVGAINANVVVEKTSSLFDPLNEGKFYVPGEVVIYAIKVSNLGDPVTNGMLIITDALPSQISLSRYAFDGTTTEPIKFVDGTGVAISGVTCCTPAQLQYSTDNGATYAYLPPASLFDSSITHVRINPSGQMNAGTANQREFTILLKAIIK
jgi:large repetitive protein